MRVPLLDLKKQYQGIKQEIETAVYDVLESQHLILGPKVSELEEKIAQYCHTKHAIGVSSGTDALLVALMTLDIKPGDKVITTPYSFFATAGVIARLGAQPVFVDIDPLTYNLSTERLASLLNKNKQAKYKAIIPVHLFGQCADMDPLLELARTYDIKVIEDAAQALGAKYKDREAGSLGDIGCFSFYPTKNLGGIGDGGMVVTNDSQLAEKIRLLRVHGAKDKYHHSLIGGNFRLDAIQSAVLLVKLKYLDQWTKKRQENAVNYDKLFTEAGLDTKIKLPHRESHNFHIFNQYVIRVPDRDKLQQFLKDNDIATEIYYPVPFHLQECFKYLGYQKGDFPGSETAAMQTLALPIYPELVRHQQEYVVSKIDKFLAMK